MSIFSHTIKIYDANLIVGKLKKISNNQIFWTFIPRMIRFLCTITDSTNNFILFDKNFAMLSSTENVRSGIILNNLAENQCLIKYNKIFSFSYNKFCIYNFEI
jgi:hypothetical protein